MKWLLIPLLAVLAGCASNPAIVVKTERVEVPVPVPCRVKTPEKPVWAVAVLPAGATLFKRVQAMAVEIEQRIGYETRLEAAVKSCQ